MQIYNVHVNPTYSVVRSAREFLFILESVDLLCRCDIMFYLIDIAIFSVEAKIYNLGVFSKTASVHKKSLCYALKGSILVFLFINI